MMKHIFRPFSLIASVLVLSACVTTPAPMPEMTFSHLTPIALAVSRIEVTSTYTSPMKVPHVEHSAPMAPEKALRLWAARRLTAVGGAGVARLVIENASLTDVRLKTQKGLKGAFTTDQSDRFEGSVKAELRIYQGGAAAAGYVVAEATHSRTLAEDASVTERRRVQFELVEALMADFDKEMEKNIRAYLGRWLK